MRCFSLSIGGGARQPGGFASRVDGWGLDSLDALDFVETDTYFGGFLEEFCVPFCTCVSFDSPLHL
jgi:hypothetical protein